VAIGLFGFYPTRIENNKDTTQTNRIRTMQIDKKYNNVGSNHQDATSSRDAFCDNAPATQKMMMQSLSHS
jgi:hypothetical protein